MLNTIAGRFTGCEKTSFTSRRYTSQVLNIEYFYNEVVYGETKTPKIKVSFSEKNAIGIHPHNDTPWSLQLHMISGRLSVLVD